MSFFEFQKASFEKARGKHLLTVEGGPGGKYFIIMEEGTSRTMIDEDLVNFCH